MSKSHHIFYQCLKFKDFDFVHFQMTSKHTFSRNILFSPMGTKTFHPSAPAPASKVKFQNQLSPLSPEVWSPCLRQFWSLKLAAKKINNTLRVAWSLKITCLIRQSRSLHVAWLLNILRVLALSLLTQTSQHAAVQQTCWISVLNFSFLLLDFVFPGESQCS